MATLLKKQLRRAKETYKCLWCGEPIPRHGNYLWCRVNQNGEVKEQEWHCECYDYCVSDSGTLEFTPYTQKRPTKH